jgi:hypothetical protein
MSMVRPKYISPKWQRDELKTRFANALLTESKYDLPLLLISHLGPQESLRVEKEIMDIRKEFDIDGYRFALGIIDTAHFTVGFKSVPGIKGFGPAELRKYRKAMYHAQMEMKKLQLHVEHLLRESMLA